MTAVSCEDTADRKAQTWEPHRARFDRLELVISDAAQGIAQAVSRVAQARHDDPRAPALEHGRDVSPTAMEADRVPARPWRTAEARWDAAGAAEAEVASSRQQGIDARGVAPTARSAGNRAIAWFEGVERPEAAWQRAPAAPDLFGADGRLNDRARAELEIAEALTGLTDPDGSKVRHFWNDRRSVGLLDRMHRRLEEAEPGADWRPAMAWRWWLLHRREPCPDPLSRLIRAVGRDRVLDESEPGGDDRVSAV